jgi:hypothetical protein
MTGVAHLPNARTASQVKAQGDTLGSKAYFNDDVAGTKQVVQVGPTLIYGYEIHNVSAADAFLLCYNKLTADVTVGTTVPDYVVPNAANAVKGKSLAVPLVFETGLVIASTTATDGASAAAQDVSLEYA